jgi:hypothetical protein
MGLLKQMKDLKATVAVAPSMIQQGQAMAANAAAMQHAYAGQMQQAAAYHAAAAQPLPAETLRPINGVDLATYAWVAKRIAEVGYDQSQAPAFAAQKGITGADWDIAAAGWSSRMQSVPALGQEFRRCYDVA